ncbi:hypothetical protein ACZ87_03891 [Candidatus Erwinia dacicola]|uniref:Uncharacterized protein n=1 Tax=Candidatus Erwinia dacicola TaxID=252393 RepID=A0A328TDU0_9GAMM|nr:hypothetical protein ACZ87_03891 [Candidatus Erwinia dacicola]
MHLLSEFAPSACEHNTTSITISKPSMVQIPHQAYIDAVFITG